LTTYISELVEKALERGVSIKTIVYQDIVESEIEDKLLNFMINNKFSLSEVYLSTYLKKVNTMKRLTLDWQNHYSKIMVNAYKETVSNEKKEKYKRRYN
jgi:hypothetical protein